MPKFYLTTAIDYSNGDPHLGHALEKIGADCIARYHRLRGDDVHFLMGMDEHSQSVIQAAARSGVTPQAWVDRMADTFAGYWRRLGCRYDDWIRTTEPRHARSVTALLERIRQRQPWGIPFPGDPQQTVYVWFDALINYLSATGFPEAGFERLWPADLHVIGKGITRFHCVIWPAMLLAAELPPPRAVWAHGYVQWSGAKMSKTAGAAVSLSEAIDYHGADALRYFLLREVGFENDGDFTWERFDARYTSELADTIGNLVSRSLTMIANYRGAVVPRDPCNYDTPLERAARGALATYASAMDANRVQEGAAQLVALAGAANRYVEETAPYKLAKQPERAAELDSVLANLARTVGRLAVLAQPFLPATSQTIWGTLGPSPSERLASIRLTELGTLDLAGRHILKPPILFPKPRAAQA